MLQFYLWGRGGVARGVWPALSHRVDANCGNTPASATLWVHSMSRALPESSLNPSHLAGGSPEQAVLADAHHQVAGRDEVVDADQIPVVGDVIRAVVLSVVLDNDFQIGPVQVGVAKQFASVVEDRRLKHWLRKSGASQKQPHKCLGPRLGALPQKKQSLVCETRASPVIASEPGREFFNSHVGARVVRVKHPGIENEMVANRNEIVESENRGEREPRGCRVTHGIPKTAIQRWRSAVVADDARASSGAPGPRDVKQFGDVEPCGERAAPQPSRSLVAEVFARREFQ